MDGILDDLLRLEDAKHHALIDLDPAIYDRSVREQLALLEDSRVSAEACIGSQKLLALSKLTGINATLYLNLLSTAPWIAAVNRAYTGQGQMAELPASYSFSAEV